MQAVLFQVRDLLIEGLALAGQLGLKFAIASLGKQAVEPAFLSAVELGDKLLAPGLQFNALGVCSLLEAVLLAFKASQHRFHPLVGKRHTLKHCGNLLGDGFLSHRRAVLMPARFQPFGTVEIDVALLGLRRHHAAADGTTKEAAIQKRLQSAALGFGADRHGLLTAIKERLGHQRLVNAVVKLSFEAEGAVVDGVLEHALNGGRRHDAALDALDLRFAQKGSDLFKGVVAGGEKLERPFDVRPGLFAQDELLATRIGAVAEQGRPRPDALHRLAAFAPLDVLRKAVHVILGLGEHHGEHELARSAVLKGEGGKAQVKQHADVKQVDDVPAVAGVAGEAVGMPGEDALGIASLNAAEHVIEDGAAGPLGGELLGKNVDDVEFLLSGKFAEFRHLVVDGADLTGLVIGRLANVHDVFERLLWHNSSVNRRIIRLCCAIL